MCLKRIVSRNRTNSKLRLEKNIVLRAMITRDDKIIDYLVASTESAHFKIDFFLKKAVRLVNALKRPTAYLYS